MTEIVKLVPREGVALDVGRLERLFARLGPAEGEAATLRALAEIGRRCERMEAAVARGERAAAAGQARALARAAGPVGLSGIARAAEAAARCAAGGDAVALAALAARIARLTLRVGAAVWDLEDISV